MSAVLEGKTIVIVLPSQGTAPSTDAPVGAGAHIDAVGFRRNLMQTGGPHVDPASGSGAGQYLHPPHHRHNENPYLHHNTPQPAVPLQGAGVNQTEFQVRPAGNTGGVDMAPQSPRPNPARGEDAPLKEAKKDPRAEGDTPTLKDKNGSPERTQQTDKSTLTRDEKITDPKATLATSEKIGPHIDSKGEPVMPDRSTPIGDLLKPDRIRDFIAGTHNLSTHHQTARTEPAQPSSNTITAPEPTSRHETRPDAQRIIQQVIIPETITHRATSLTIDPLTANSFQIGPTQNIQTATVMADLRTSTLDKLTQMKSALEITVERATPHLATDQLRPTDPSPQTAGVFSYVEPVRHQAAPFLSIQAEDRTASTRDDTHSRAEKGNVILDGLAEITKKIANIENLRALDRTFENACLAMFAAAALGVMATDRVLRELLALAREAEERLREESPNEELETGEFVGMQDAARQLEEELAAKKSAEAGLVGDITGVVADATIGRPLGGARIDAGPLGVFETNAWGEFHIKNVPLGTDFRLIPSLFGYSFDPDVIFSAVGVTNYFNIAGIRSE